MIIKYKTSVNRCGNSYGLIVDTDKKQYQKGFGICSSWDFIVKKSDIEQFITYTLKTSGYTERGAI